MSDAEKPAESFDARRAVLTWLGQAKPTEWLTAIAACIGLTVAFRSGVFDAHRADISARTERLTVEKLMLEQRKERLTKDIEVSRRELDDVKSRLTPLQREKAATLRILDIRKNNSVPSVNGDEHLSVGFSFNPDFDGYSLSAASYITVQENGGYSYYYDRILTHPKFSDLLVAAEELGSVTDLKIGKLRVDDEDIKTINKLGHLKSIAFINSGLSSQTLSLLELGPSLKYLFFINNKLVSFPKFNESNKIICIDASENPIDDDCIEQIAQSFPHLEFLHLNGTKITGAGIRHIIKMKKLDELSLYDTNLKSEDLKRITDHPGYMRVKIEMERIPKEFVKDANSKIGGNGKILFEDTRGNTPPPPVPDFF